MTIEFTPLAPGRASQAVDTHDLEEMHLVVSGEFAGALDLQGAGSDGKCWAQLATIRHPGTLAVPHSMPFLRLIVRTLDGGSPKALLVARRRRN